jgi:excisionase family DNA binding protein
MAEIKRLLTESTLGSRLNVATKEIRGMVHRNEIPFVKLPGGQIRFEIQAVEKWIQKHNSPAQSEGKQS